MFVEFPLLSNSRDIEPCELLVLPSDGGLCEMISEEFPLIEAISHKESASFEAQAGGIFDHSIVAFGHKQQVSCESSLDFATLAASGLLINASQFQPSDSSFRQHQILLSCEKRTGGD